MTRCKVCRCTQVYTGENPEGCGISVRVYVNTAGLIEAISPPCPSAEMNTARVVILDAWCLFGSIDMGRAHEPTGEVYERDLAVEHATVLGYRLQNLWASGLWEDGDDHKYNEELGECDIGFREDVPNEP